MRLTLYRKVRAGGVGAATAVAARARRERRCLVMVKCNISVMTRGTMSDGSFRGAGGVWGKLSVYVFCSFLMTRRYGTPP